MDDAHRRQFFHGIELFNSQDFYDCHDTIEDIWLQESSDVQPFLQGMIQSAVAFHHHGHGRWGAARTMLKLAIDKLQGYPDVYEGIQLGSFLESIQGWKDALNQALAGGDRSPIELSYPKILSSE